MQIHTVVNAQPTCPGAGPRAKAATGSRGWPFDPACNAYGPPPRASL